MGGQKKLTPKQEKFARLIAEGKSHSDALRGSYCCSKMKAATIQNKAYKLLCESHISTRVDELKKEVADKHLLTREELLIDLIGVYKADIAEMISEVEEVDGIQVVRWKDSSTWTKTQRRAVKAIKNTNLGIQLEFHDIVQVGDRIAKMQGFDAPTKHELKQVDEFSEMTEEEIDKELGMLNK